MIFKRNYAIFGIFLAFNLLSLTSNFSAPHDSINYLNGIEEARDLLHPHHLLYHITTFAFFKVFKLILPFIENHYLIEAVNALWGAGVLLMVNLFLRKRFQISPVTAFIGTCLPAFSFGIWFYSANIEVYMPPIFLILLLLYKLTKQDFTNRDFLWVISLHALSILFHEVNVLLTPVLLLKFFWERERYPFMSRLVKYALIGGGFVLVTYVLSAWLILGIQSKDQFITWIRGYSSQSEYWFPLSFKTLINAVVGIGHAFIGAHFMFQVSFVRDYINTKFFYHSLEDETFLVRSISSQEALMLLILSMIFALFLAISVIKVAANYKRIFPDKKLVGLILATFGIYSVFFFFWMPENLEFWLLQVVLLWIFIAGGLAKFPTVLKIKTNIWMGIMAALLLIVNYFGSMRWMQDINNDYFYAKIEKVKNEAGPQDLILLKDGWIIKEYLHRYTKAPSMIIPRANDDSARVVADSIIQRTLSGGHSVYLYTDESFMHAVKNQGFVDSLLQANAGKIDSVKTDLYNMKIISGR